MNPSTKRTFTVIAAVVLIAGLAAAALFATMNNRNSEPTTTEQTTKTTTAITAKNACELITASQVSQITGKEYTYQEKYRPGANNGEPTDSSLIRVSNCPYAASDVERVDIGVKSPGTLEDQEQTIAALKDEYKHSKKLSEQLVGYKEVADLGEDAYWNNDSATLYVLSGNYYYQFQVLTTGDTLQEATKLAQTADL